MYESKRIWSDILPVTTLSGKHGIHDGIPRISLKTLEDGSKLFHLVQNCLYMKWKIFGNVIKLIGHNLESAGFSTEYRIIC